MLVFGVYSKIDADHFSGCPDYTFVKCPKFDAEESEIESKLGSKVSSVCNYEQKRHKNKAVRLLSASLIELK
ncbi:MAG: hypothetical protein Q8L47_03525 [bacterium]|nr:hypothetical protein [bacterium]